MPLGFHQVNVFSADPVLGNPVAVVHDADGLSDKQMAAFARWTNLSETTFVLRPTHPASDYRLRIFTPGGELPFAGHPTLGSARRARGAHPGARLLRLRGARHRRGRAAPAGQRRPGRGARLRAERRHPRGPGHGTLPPSYVAAQGTALGRAGRLHIDTDRDGTIWVGGDTVTTIVGAVALRRRSDARDGT
jgi:predicted PhzF superfamily epimerase YddE/YHI9